MIRQHEESIRHKDYVAGQLQSEADRYKAMLDEAVTNSEAYLVSSADKLRSVKGKAKLLQAKVDSLYAENRSLATHIEELNDVIAANKIKNRKLMSRQAINDLMLDVADHQAC